MSQILTIGKNIACIISDFFNSGAEIYFTDFRIKSENPRLFYIRDESA